MSQPEFMSGEELWDRFDSHYCKHNSVRTRFSFREIPSVRQRAWNDLAAELKVPRPKVPTLEEVYDLWEDDFEFEDRIAEDKLEILRQRLNAAHEAKERRA